MDKQARTLVIINPASAGARRSWPRIKDRLRQNGISFDAHEATHAGDATERTRAALRDHYEVIAVVGGDGTLSEAAAGFFEFQDDENEAAFRPPSQINGRAALAILPAGTGDDFARGMAGGRRVPLEKWLETFIAYVRLRSSPGHLIDVIHGQATSGERDFICINVSTIGLGAEVAARVGQQGNAMKRLPGEARFVSAALGALARWRERRVRVTFDESEPVETTTNLIAIANSTHAGGGMMFAPGARVDDGLIDLMLTQDLTRSTILRELPRIRRGEHLSNPKVSVIKARRVRVETKTLEDALLVEADGNLRGRTPAEFQIVPRSLRVIS
ncbi:MAG: diacylglycerol kinase family lipid kinase [Acidobacteriota bacterium]|nr:diacylglycerol kinase family lipid kinase [Acidobacteriota bacterium]